MLIKILRNIHGKIYGGFKKVWGIVIEEMTMLVMCWHCFFLGDC